MLLAAPKYQTAYACEGKKLTIECDPGDLINLIRANYGRFSITICNDHGNVEWSVNCMFPKSLTVLNSRCSHKQSCSVLATTSMFGDPCPGTHKYLEAHYQCISASQTTSTTTNRPSPPPWVLTNTPSLLPNGSAILNPTAIGGVIPPPNLSPVPPRLPALPGSNDSNGVWNVLPSSPGPPTLHTTLPGGRLKGGSNNSSTPIRQDGLPSPPSLHHHHHHTNHQHTSMAGSGVSGGPGGSVSDGTTSGRMPNDMRKTSVGIEAINGKTTGSTADSTTPSNNRILTGMGGNGNDDSSLITGTHNRGHQQQQQTQQLPQSTSTIAVTGTMATAIGGGNEDDSNMYCGPTNARNLFWNITRVGDVNVQPCPGGATGIAKWRCVLMKRLSDINDDAENTASTSMPQLCQNDTNSTNCELVGNKMNHRSRNFEPTWHPMTPDLTQCRSLWLNSLEVRVNQRDSSLISIANDLSEVTSSKTLYGGDMLVTTKIIQTMSEKMFHDKETFPDQRQREAIILELLHGVVKTGSNLLDESQLASWLDLNQEDQMRVATSLLTGLEYNAFLLADTIIRERNVVQKVKNILLSVRVLETKNIQSSEVFPDAEQWQISDDRIELPRAALLENSEGGLVRIVFAAFDRLESILKPSYDHFDLKSARSYIRNTVIIGNDTDKDSMADGAQQRIRILNSKVISASLGKGRHIQLSQPIKLVLKHIKTENVTNPTCVFWNYIDHAWSANGCSLESSNRTHSICICNHLTNFAILMDVVDEHNHSLFTMFDGNMRILIYISISICLVFIIIALLTLKIFNGGFIKSARASIYRNIYICLLCIEILFLLGIEQTETSIFCGFITVFLHCSILAGIAWFCFEAFQSYSTLTTDDILLEVDQTSKVNCYYLLSYGLSLTVVAISLAINPSTYTQNDYCTLMEGSTLFYATFVAPVALFFLSALIYAFLSWIIMSRKSRTTLKTKEHTRLANVRFDLRCYFIFLVLLCGVWVSAYYYLRLSKVDDESANIFGYFFVGFNTLMGLYIFVFHCIQNEKIRREYGKYVRKNSWLPKCLRCSKTSISSGMVGGGSSIGGGAGMGAGHGGTLNSINAGGSSSNSTQIKKSKFATDCDGIDNDDSGGIITAGEDAIMASSDCELNESQIQRTQGGGPTGSVSGGTLKSGIIPGNIVLQHGKVNSIIDSIQGHVVLERGGTNSSMGGPGASGTLRSTAGSASIIGGGGIHTPSGGHTSPTSSAGSTHLIFGHGHKQQIGTGSIAGGAPPETYYHHPDYYSWKQQKGGAGGGYHPTNGVSPQQTHEFFYWTQKHQQGKKKRGSGIVLAESPSGSLHSRTTAGASQQVLFCPSYKKTTAKNQPQQYPQYQHYSEAIEHGNYYHQQQQQQHPQNRRYPPTHMQPPHQQHFNHQQQQQQQLSSDDEQMEPAAHAHLLHLNRRGGPQLPPLPSGGHHQYPPDLSGMHAPPLAQQRYYRNKHSNCDLSQEYDGTHHPSDTYYNQGSLNSDGPVYEEILSNRSSDVHHYDVGRVDEDDGDVVGEKNYNHDRVYNGGFGKSKNGIAATSKRNGGTPSQRRHFKNNSITNIDDDGDEGADVEEDDESACDDENELDDKNRLNSLAQNDERMRRLMAMQDEDFQRRFQRQQRKNGAITAEPIGVYPEYDQQQNDKTQKQQQQHPTPNNTSSVFGVSGGGGNGSIRSFKKISPSGRLALNELLNHPAPPLPPANQHPMQKRQQPQQHQQQISPQSTTSSTSSSQKPQPQQPIIGRNISAMLDENNTVRCYLEPLTK